MCTGPNTLSSDQRPGNSKISCCLNRGILHTPPSDWRKSGTNTMHTAAPQHWRRAKMGTSGRELIDQCDPCSSAGEARLRISMIHRNVGSYPEGIIRFLMVVQGVQLIALALASTASNGGSYKICDTAFAALATLFLQSCSGKFKIDHLIRYTRPKTPLPNLAMLVIIEGSPRGRPTNSAMNSQHP